MLTVRDFVERQLAACSVGEAVLRKVGARRMRTERTGAWGWTTSFIRTRRVVTSAGYHVLGNCP